MFGRMFAADASRRARAEMDQSREASSVCTSLDRRVSRGQFVSSARNQDRGFFSGAPVNIQEILARLKGVRRSGDGWTAKCPAHEDKKPSLSISQRDGKILVHCHAGCTVESICRALRLTVSDLFLDDRPSQTHPHAEANSKPSGSGRSEAFRGTEADVERMQCDFANNRQVQEYVESRGICLRVATNLKWGAAKWEFRDEQGQWVEKLALAVPHYRAGKLVGIKFRAIDGTKLFSQLLGSCLDGLYALGHLDPNGTEVLILEGPEDVALAISHGFQAVAINATEAKAPADDVGALLRHKRIFLIGDQDVAGQRAMNKLQLRLPAEQAIRVRMPGFKDVGDLWKSNPAHFSEHLKRILRFARASRVHFELDDLLTESEIRPAGNIERYAVDQLVPLNDISMFFSEEKGGKSLLITYIGKCVSNGVAVFGKYSTRKMPVVVLDLEASDADIAGYLSHFSRLGVEQIRYFTRKTGVPPLDSPALLRLCERERPLLVLESLTKFVTAAGPEESMFDPAAMSRFFDKVLNLCAAGATVLISHHATRADVERYADSHQIGAAVARAYVVVSLDRPRLERIRLEAKLCRGAEPITENLVAFPVIAQRGEFGLANVSGTDPDVERVVEFVRSKGKAQREEIKKKGGVGIKTSRAVAAITRALKVGLLIEDSKRFLSIPSAGNGASKNPRSKNSGTVGTDQ
jgi:hypothetical protein